MTLASGPLRCVIDPALGGSLVSLRHGALPVLREAPAGQPPDVRAGAGYPLLPYSNRIGHARLPWQGHVHRLQPNFAPEPHAIHGIGWRRPWRVLQADTRSARLALSHRADADWPFDFEAEQHLTLEPQAFGLELRLTHAGQDGLMPAGLGWHPYFCKRPGARLQFAARGRWAMGPDQLPTGHCDGGGIDGMLDVQDVDHCFEGWDGEVRWQDDQLRLMLRSDLDRLVVFTSPQRPFVAIEPVSHVNNALQLAQSLGRTPADLGMRSLAPGASCAAWMRLEIRPA